MHTPVFSEKEPAIKDPVGELAKVSCSHDHMLSQPQHFCCLSPVLLFIVLSGKYA